MAAHEDAGREAREVRVASRLPLALYARQRKGRRAALRRGCARGEAGPAAEIHEEASLSDIPQSHGRVFRGHQQFARGVLHEPCRYIQGARIPQGHRRGAGGAEAALRAFPGRMHRARPRLQVDVPLEGDGGSAFRAQGQAQLQLGRIPGLRAWLLRILPALRGHRCGRAADPSGGSDVSESADSDDRRGARPACRGHARSR